jgi:Ca-activated chloride channel family protein
MRFLWSDVLWLLLVIPLLAGVYVYALRRRSQSALRYASLMLVREAIGPWQWLRRHLPALLLALGLACALLGAARPTVELTLPSQHQTVVLAIDVSLSMRAGDMEPTRLAAAQNAVKAFVKDLPPNVRVGIVTFAGSASVVQTPTRSRDELIAAVDRFELQRQTAIGSGLLVALSLLLPDADIAVEADGYSPRAFGQPLKAAPRPDFKPAKPGSHASGAIVLLSDGRRTTGPDPLKAARLAAERGVRVHTVGFGTQGGAPVDFDGRAIYMQFDEAALKAIAALTEGEYFHASSAAALHKVYKNLTSKLVLERGETEVTALFGAAAALFVLMAAMLSLLWFHRAA